MGLIYNTKEYFAHKDDVVKSDLDKRFESIEYHLICFGELAAPYLGGGPEHNIEARWIFRERPYRLFSVTDLGRIPQELCLMFDCYVEEKKVGSGRSIGPPIEEVTKEFSALLSLVARRRVSLLAIRRRENYPVNEVPYTFTAHYRADDLPVNRSFAYGLSGVQPLYHYNPHREISEKEFKDCLDKLLELDARIAEGFVLSLGLYHAALENMHQNTDVAYLLLVSAIEALASIEFRSLGNRERFTKFASHYLPDSFWETKDDFYLMSENWNKYTKEDIEECLNRIYSTRNKALHQGVPFPAHIDLGLRDKVKADAALSLSDRGTKPTSVLPSITWFERVVNSCLLTFLVRTEEKNQ
jgi:hypothetical protein